MRQKRKAESQKEERESQAARAEEEEAGPGQTAIRTDPSAPPNEILFVQGLPGECAPTTPAVFILYLVPRTRRQKSFFGGGAFLFSLF